MLLTLVETLHTIINKLPLVLSFILLTIYFFKSDNEIKTVKATKPKGELFTVKAGSIYDGDTMRVFSPEGVEHATPVLKIRFACVDAPELKQPLGTASRDYLRSVLASAGNKVYLDIVDTDSYGRKVAVIYLPNGKPVQIEQVENGWGYPYEKYKSNCPIWDEILEAEKIAIKNQVNLYGANHEKPWDYRRNN